MNTENETLILQLIFVLNIKKERNILFDVKQISGWHFNFHILVLYHRINNEVGMKSKRNGESKVFKDVFLAELFILLYFSQSFSWITYNKENLLLTPKVINHQKIHRSPWSTFVVCQVDCGFRVHMNVVTLIDFSYHCVTWKL